MENQTRRVWLVGEHNPVSSDPRHALYPAPPGCAGARLCDVLELTVAEYLRRFERRNLLDTAKWSAPRARAAADALLAAHPALDRLVLLGARVAAAFGVDFRTNLCEPRFMQVGSAVLRGRGVLVVPHPSGLSREWNDRTMAPRVRAAFKRLEEDLA